MQNWFDLFPKNTGLSLFAWIAFCLLPFYFIIRSSTSLELFAGLFAIILFFTTYRAAFIKKGWTVYLAVAIEMAISIGMTIYFSYVYFALFLAFFIGNIQNRAGFLSLYIVHLVTTLTAVGFGFYLQPDVFAAQLPFVVIGIIGVILLPFNIYNRNKRDKLERELEDANERLSQLSVLEERQRIARDLHDTLGQKLSLIGLKSDLAGKLVLTDPTGAKSELLDIQNTARTALKEVRELVAGMKGTKLEDELIRVRQLLAAANIELQLSNELSAIKTPLLVGNVLSMCLKEAVNNIVKHSGATVCRINIGKTADEWLLQVGDNGSGMKKEQPFKGNSNGIYGMIERLEFVNGNLKIDSADGTLLTIRIPHAIQQMEQEDSI